MPICKSAFTSAHRFSRVGVSLLRSSRGVAIALISLVPLRDIATELSPQDQARKAYESKNYEEAKNILEPLAAKGDPEAETALGIMYEFGQGVVQNYENAFSYLKLGAEKGVPKAETQLGYFYSEGLVGEKNYPESLKWYLRAAEHGSGVAAFNLGLMYTQGQGASVDYPQAYKWYSKALELGNVKAETNIAGMYANGLGVPQDFSIAFHHYLKAAERGNITAQAAVGGYFNQGLVVSQDKIEACKWFGLAVSHEKHARLSESEFQRISDAKILYDSIWNDLTPESSVKNSETGGVPRFVGNLK